MRKTYRIFVALVMCILGGMSANAGEIISLQEVPFCTWDDWGANARSTGAAECAWVIGEPTGQPYGDSKVNNYADLSSYSKLIVVATEGTPRFLLNRDMVEGQCSATESESHLIDNTNSGCMTWAAKYFYQEGNTYVVDLKQITKDKGFCHLHAIKGANWANVTIESMELETVGKAKQIGWINLINNSDMEGDDVSSFFTKVAKGAPEPSVITDGVGVNGSRGIVVEATAKESDAWDNQFWFRFNEIVPADAKYRVSFDYRADAPAKASTQAHAEPSDYIHYQMLGDVNFTPEWQTFTAEGTVSAQQAGPNSGGGLFTSIAFNLNELADANNYYFDNIVFEVYKAGISAEYSSDVVQIDFGFDTNIPALLAKTGMPRLLFPKECAQVKVDGEVLEIITVEGYPDGRFYIFTEEAIDGKEVIVTLKNPSDPAFHLVYTNGPGGDVPNFEDVAEENDEVAMVDDAYSYEFLKPTVLRAEPENGSFNLPNDIKEFKIFLDKDADCARIQATMGKEKLTVSPAEGFAKEITLTRTGEGELATGAYIIKVTNIFCKDPLVEDDFTSYTFTINVGKVEADPTDVPKDMMATDLFANTAQGGIPAGFIVKFVEEERNSESSYSSGPRLFDFGNGGDFNKGLYLREGYAEYGSTAGYELRLEANKKYRIRFNSAMWKDNGSKLRFEIFNEAEEIILCQMVTNAPNVNGSQGDVKGSTYTEIDFIPEATGDYRLRWTTAADETADPSYMEVVLANVGVKYIPNTVGVEETQKLNESLANAKTVRDENAAERYAGEAYTALVTKIEKYDAEKDGYTAPSAYFNAADDLDAAATAVKDHRTNCDTYDQAIKKSIDVVRDNAETKFAVTDLYKELQATNEKYHAYSVMEENPDPDSETGYTYFFDVLTDDAVLQEAAKELADATKLAGYMFTEGESKTSTDVGIKVLVDRIRQGAEGLKQLGVAEDDPLIVAANNAVTDDDELAEQLKNRIKAEFYAKMKDGVDMFPEQVDESTLETTTPKYNFTVFVKNPNTYAWKENGVGITEENCPGWVAVEGNPGLTNAWNGSYPGDIDGLPKDLLITQYHAANRIEQTIYDLPAGIYNVMIDCTEWSDEFSPKDGDDEETIAQKEANHEQNRYYVKTSETPEYVAGQEEPEEFAADGRIDYNGQYVARHENFLEGVQVVDGQLTIGVKWNNLAQMMFDRVQIFLAGGAAGFNYASAYEEVMVGIDEAAKAAKVRALEVYDLNGRRLPAAGQKGIVIVKKYMSDGTVRTEKAIK